MSVNLFCPGCKSSHSLSSKSCPKCGNSFLNDRKYRVMVMTSEGKRVSKIVDSLQTAKNLEAKFKTRAIEERFFDLRPELAVSAAWAKFLAWAKVNKKTWRTDQLRWDKHVAGRLGNKPMDKVTPGDITNLMTDLKAAGYAPASVKHILVLIKRLYNWSSKQGLYKGANPATRVTAPKVNNARTECLTREEIGRLMAVLDAHRNRPLALMVKFALLTGLRRGEIFKLDWRNVSLDEGFITLIDPKGGKDTVLPLSLAALDVLRQARDNQLSDQEPNGLVFPSRNGTMRTECRASWESLKRQAALPREFRFHGLRHTFASYIASSGKVSMFTLQKLLTHKSPQMTQRYSHLLDSTLREGANAFTAMIS